MRGDGILAAALMLSACQMALPDETDTVPAGAEEQLSQEFTSAAAEAKAEETGTAPKKGLFAFLKPAKPPSPLTGTGIEVVEGSSSDHAMTVMAVDKDEPYAARPETHGVTAASPSEEKAPSLFGFFKPTNGGAGEAAKTLSTVKPGEVLRFGEVGVACEATRRTMGKKVDQFPRKGRPVWQLYDTDPSNTGPRTQFITGFSDGCARQVTAALVMFGAASLHEVLRYSEGNDRPWTEADKSYEKIKRQACGVGREKRCPAAKIGALEKKLAFVSAYPQFGAERGILELLLHNGAVMSEEMR